MVSLVTLLVSSTPASAGLNTSSTHAWYSVGAIPELQEIGRAKNAVNITVPYDMHGKVLKYIAVNNSDTAGDEVPKKIKLAAVGDISCNNRYYRALADAIKQYEPDKVLLLGDYSYRIDDARCFTDAFSFPADKVIAVHGNHDNHYWDSKHRPTYGMMMKIGNAYNIHIPGSYYKYHNVAFITIDNSLAKSPRGLASIDEHSVTYALARYNLSMAKMDKSIDWRIVLMHIPLNVGATDAVAKVREPYAMMLDDAGVDIVLSGDTHHYTRTYPIKGINSVVSRDRSSYDFSKEHGRIQYIIGTGGADQSNADEVKGIVAASIGRERLRGNPAYLQIEITNDVNNTTMKSRLVDINGNIYDEASISKKRDASKQVSIEEVYLYVDGGMVKTGVIDDRRFFDGSDGRMAMLNHDDRMNGKRLSIALWFLSESKGSNRPAVLIEKGNPVIKANISFLLGIDSKGSIVYEWDGQDGKRYSLVSSDGKKKDHHYADGRWHHLAVVRDGASVIMYIDGIPVASGEFKAMPVSNEYDIYINAMPDYSQTAKAMIDAIGVWDRALSAEEVLALYHGDDSAREDAIVYEGFDGEGKKHVFTVYAGESLSMRWYGVDGYGRGTVIVLSNGIYMQPWQSISIFKASTTMNGAHGAMYHEAFFGSSGL
ncbi:MAG: LamG-like jellyroll fold domain-containing protein [Candidatus Nitrosocaldus sp.]